MKGFLFSVLFLGLISCKGDSHVQLSEVTLTDVQNREVQLGSLTGETNAVFIFLSPDCPLCINYTKTIRELADKYKDKPVKFIPVYTGGYNSGNEILKFQEEYNFEIPGLMDPDLQLVKLLDASITPEAFVITPAGEKVYSGAIDNWMYETGKKRTAITENYLDAALTQLLNDKKPNPERTEPVGCFIEQ